MLFFASAQQDLLTIQTEAPHLTTVQAIQYVQQQQHAAQLLPLACSTALRLATPVRCRGVQALLRGLGDTLGRVTQLLREVATLRCAFPKLAAVHPLAGSPGTLALEFLDLARQLDLAIHLPLSEWHHPLQHLSAVLIHTARSLL